MRQSPRVVGALAFVLGCADTPVETMSSPPVSSSVAAASASAPLPVASELPQSPGCQEALVTTLCGKTVRCRTDGKDRKIFKEGDPIATDSDDCLRALRDVRDLLRDIEREPIAHGEWPGPPPHFTCMPEMAETQRAYREILARVRKEGVARTRQMAEQGAYWADLIRERFDLSSVTTGCRSEAGFLVSVSAGVGAPGSLPYSGLFKLSHGKPPITLAELSDGQPMAHWSVGDLDGDGVEEEVVRFLLKSDDGESQGVRYELADVKLDKLLLIELRPKEDQQKWAEEPIAAVRLPSGTALAVGKRLLVYKDRALVDAPASAVEERRAFEKTARERARAVREKLDAPPPAGDPCSDARLGFAIKLAAELREAGVVRGFQPLSIASELVRTKQCPAWATLGLDR